MSAPTLTPRMVVCDMDGTLLDPTGLKVSDRNASALRRAGEAGARVVIATGRPIWWLGPVIEAGFTGVAVCMNGAVVYDIAADSIIAASPLSVDTMVNFVDLLTEQTDFFAIAVERLGTGQSSAWAEPSYDHPWGGTAFRIAERTELLSEPAAKMLIRGNGDSQSLFEAARATGSEEVGLTYSTEGGLLEVSAVGVNKSTALDRLATQWGIGRDEVIAFGDMPNDLEMLHWAGFGVAMGNAHPDLVAIATEVGAHHGDDGVAEVLERWF